MGSGLVVGPDPVSWKKRMGEVPAQLVYKVSGGYKNGST